MVSNIGRTAVHGTGPSILILRIYSLNQITEEKDGSYVGPQSVDLGPENPFSESNYGGTGGTVDWTTAHGPIR